MEVIKDVIQLKSLISQWKQQGDSIAFVPTMGNLHQGHLALVKKARQLATRVVVSIYVNPLQFGENEDFDSYPRTLEQDQKGLELERADLLFLPASSAIYPRSEKDSTKVEVPNLSTILCGEYRPGHFVGVATVVCKLLNIIQADFAIFGEKDYQQLAVIRQMVEDLFIPVEIIGVATVRNEDGLAMSSRNQYLTAEQKKKAAFLYQTLKNMAKDATKGISLRQIEQESMDKLAVNGFRPEYLSFRECRTLAEAQTDQKELIILAAAWLGNTRLIDNLQITLQKSI